MKSIRPSLLTPEGPLLASCRSRVMASPSTWGSTAVEIPASWRWTALVLGAFVWAVSCRPADGQSASLRVGPSVHASADASGLVHVEPVIAASPRDPSRLVIASMVVRRPHSPEFQDSGTVVVYASRDGGDTWHERPLPLPGDRVAGDPWLTWTSGDVVYLSAIVTRSLLRGEPSDVWVFRSTDGGWTWSELERETFGTDRDVDHPIITVADGGDGPPSLYVIGTMAYGDAEGFRVATHHGGSDGFRRLDPYITADHSGHVSLGGAVAWPGGEIAFTYFTMPEPPRSLRAVHRSAGGRWTETRMREGILPVGFPGLAVDRSRERYRGRIYATWVEEVEGTDSRELSVLVSSSADRGRSWGPPVRVHRGRTVALRALPTVAVNGDGVVAVAWLDWRNSGDRADCTELYVATSMDGGASFEPESPVSDEPSCYGTVENGATARRWRLGGGDYLGLTAGADGVFHVAWPDSRSGRFQVWTSRIRVGDAESSASPGRWDPGSLAAGAGRTPPPRRSRALPPAARARPAEAPSDERTHPTDAESADVAEVLRDLELEIHCRTRSSGQGVRQLPGEELESAPRPVPKPQHDLLLTRKASGPLGPQLPRHHERPPLDASHAHDPHEPACGQRGDGQAGYVSPGPCSRTPSCPEPRGEQDEPDADQYGEIVGGPAVRDGEGEEEAQPPGEEQCGEAEDKRALERRPVPGQHMGRKLRRLPLDEKAEVQGTRMRRGQDGTPAEPVPQRVTGRAVRRSPLAPLSAPSGPDRCRSPGRWRSWASPNRVRSIRRTRPSERPTDR